MKTKFSAKRLCRAGVIAALYVVFTYVFAPLAFGPFQIRPAEALCILPLFFVEAVPALFVGCMISNLTSPYLFYDVFMGSLITLFAAFISYMVGRYIKKDGLKIFLGGLPPVILNAFLIPMMIVFLYGDPMQTAVQGVYITMVFSFLLTQSIWVYGLGTPLYFFIKNSGSANRKKG